MKAIIFLFALVLCIMAAIADDAPGAVQISGNNVGDIVNVNADLNAVLSNNMETSLVGILAALLNQQAAVINADLPIDPTANENK